MSGTAIEGRASGVKTNLIGLSEDELKRFFADAGEAPYRGKQLFEWIYKKRIDDFETVTGFTKSLRSRLEDVAELRYPSILDARISENDGTTKFLLQLDDARKIETVLIPKEKSPDEGGRVRETVCLSTQVGCPLDCKFCATGAMKFIRNLTVGEIISQLMIVEGHARKRVTNVVFMGMGEPLLNIDAVLSAIRIMTDDRAMNIRAKGITVSTAGIPDAIHRLADEPIKFRLAVSLHSLDDGVREILMPIDKKYSLSELLPAVAVFARRRRDRVTIEYILFDGLNDRKQDLAKLIKLSREIPLKINLLRYHPLDHLNGLGLQVDPSALGLRPSGRIEEFADALRESGITVFVRSNAGEDINGACGQLAAKNVRTPKVKVNV